MYLLLLVSDFKQCNAILVKVKNLAKYTPSYMCRYFMHDKLLWQLKINKG